MSGIIEFPLIFWTEILLIFPREILLIFPTEILLASPAKFAFTVTQPWWFKTIADVIKEAILKKVPKVRTYSIWWRAQPPSISSQDLFRRKSVASTNPCQSVLCPPQFEQFRKKTARLVFWGIPYLKRNLFFWADVGNIPHSVYMSSLCRSHRPPDGGAAVISAQPPLMMQQQQAYTTSPSFIFDILISSF